MPGNPAFVLDCIDDADTKKALIVQCAKRGLPFLSACSAGAKVDPTRIHIADMRDAISTLPPRCLAWGMVCVRVVLMYGA